MTKLTRVTAKIFGETADATLTDPEIGQFGSAKAGTYNGTGDVATIQGLTAWSNGWIDAVTPTQQFPPLPEMTGVHKVLSYQNAYLLQQGIPEWDSATTYYTNGFCSKAGKIYISLTDSNLNNDPANDTVNWKDYAIDTSNFLNKQQVTNCLLEAPNGVVTYSGATITVKAGLKVLIPDGKNADGTLKNIEYSFPQDVTYTETISFATSCLTFYYNYTLNTLYMATACFIQGKEPPTTTSFSIWLNTNENVWYNLDADGIWKNNGNKIVVIGIFNRDASNILTAVKINQPLDLLKRSDKFDISGWAMPSDTYVGLTIGSSGATYTAPANGYIKLAGAGGYNGGYAGMETSQSGLATGTGNLQYTEVGVCFMPVKKNATFIVNHNNFSLYDFRFIYAVGSESEVS